jgi:mRNA interferase MazF
MRKPGQVALFRFPQTDLREGKLRPALLLGRLPGPYDDWTVCMTSTQMQHHVDGFDETIQQGDGDWPLSGLKAASVIRIGRLAAVEGGVLVGAIGEIDPERLRRIVAKLTDWLRRA